MRRGTSRYGDVHGGSMRPLDVKNSLSPYPIQTITLDRVEEWEFTCDHPQVMELSRVFREKAQLGASFDQVLESIRRDPKAGSLIVGAAWLEFTELVPWALCTLAGRVDNNLARHFVIQTAFEELGSRNRNAIHSDLFAQCIDQVGAGLSSTREWIATHPVRALETLKQSVAQASCTTEVMGLCLGLELPANENIQTLVEGIGTSESLRDRLLKTSFFRIHRVVEDEHIRLSISNYLHFCRTQKARDQFTRSFDQGIRFWREYWGEVSQRIIRGSA